MGGWSGSAEAEVPALRQLPMGRQIETIPAAVMDALVRYPWPGNVRELQNVIERAVILSPGPVLQVSLGDLEERMKDEGRRMKEEENASLIHPSSFCLHPSDETLADAERDHILGLLRETGWVLGGSNGTAARLGMKRSTLLKKMQKLGISRLE